ncbi:nucleotidyltransferase family protein [Salibacterium qingdaonense]|uniref:Polymerase nucleotidyl transferase domain-containing protein n=1 Tax=Salibacterium qingdaonense TaxID=266892 RepID=A0A1I4MCX3_9BACI|nr:nucleotidyltransferase family protein [Salibacterium qingdaonense]SFM00817.1 hypothetical protein SAMN04488054_11124 [Salibacterium qingdaonense]
MLDDLQEKRDVVLEKAQEHGMKNVRVFGSVVRSEANSASDLDLLVDVEEGRSLFDLIRFKQDMEYLFNREVDVVTENAVHWRIKENVINGAVQL